MRRVTATAVVCAAAGLFTAGALVLNPSDSKPQASASTAATTASTVARAGDGGTPDGKVANSAGASAAGAAAPAAAIVTVRDFSFTKATVAAGATVEVVNRDGVAHTVSAAKGGFDSGTVSGGADGSFTAPSKPGTYRIVCHIHPQMSGELIVRAP
jgi:plastocyanin